MLPVTGRSIEVSGDQWGTWTLENSPYEVVGEVHVPQESTLVIEPGSMVDFQGHYKLVVEQVLRSRIIPSVGIDPIREGESSAIEARLLRETL